MRPAIRKIALSLCQPLFLMSGESRRSASIFSITFPVTRLTKPLLAAAFALNMFVAVASAQTFTVLHSFDRATGWVPLAGVTIDNAGNLYGTTVRGGGMNDGDGVIYKLSRRGTGWIYSKLFTLTYDSGCAPQGKVVFGPNGTLYGTGNECGSDGAGTVFNVRPPAVVCAAVQCSWDLTVLHNFFRNTDGAFPDTLTFDTAGNIYGTTPYYGPAQLGTVWKLTPSGGSWTFSVLTDFSGTSVSKPFSVVPDADGNVYGGSNYTWPGTVFEVTNTGTVEVLHQFTGPDGIIPLYGLIFDGNGNIYGGTASGGTGSDGGTVFELSSSGGGWTFNLLYSLPGQTNGEGPPGSGAAALSMDDQGNLYGITVNDGAYGWGTVFKLAPSSGGYVYTDLHDFTGGDDGGTPWSDVVMDSQGNLYGTTSAGGASNGGTVWEITP